MSFIYFCPSFSTILFSQTRPAEYIPAHDFLPLRPPSEISRRPKHEPIPDDRFKPGARTAGEEQLPPSPRPKVLPMRLCLSLFRRDEKDHGGEKTTGKEKKEEKDKGKSLSIWH